MDAFGIVTDVVIDGVVASYWNNCLELLKQLSFVRGKTFVSDQNNCRELLELFLEKADCKYSKKKTKFTSVSNHWL